MMAPLTNPMVMETPTNPMVVPEVPVEAPITTMNQTILHKTMNQTTTSLLSMISAKISTK
jgi:hypothetical protein